MPTIAEQLTQLESDRQDLVSNLQTKGITGLTGDETFTALVPEVLNIQTGGGGNQVVNPPNRTYTGYSQPTLNSNSVTTYNYTLSNKFDIPIKNAYIYDWNTESLLELPNNTYTICNYRTTGLSVVSGQITISEIDGQKYFSIYGTTYSIYQSGQGIYLQATINDTSYTGILVLKVDTTKIQLTIPYMGSNSYLILAEATRTQTTTYNGYGVASYTTAQSSIIFDNEMYVNNIIAVSNPVTGHYYLVLYSFAGFN